MENISILDTWPNVSFGMKESLTNKKIGMFMPSVSMHEPTAQFGFWNYNERVYMLSTGAGLRGRELTLKKKK